jgi:hypothetical protein
MTRKRRRAAQPPKPPGYWENPANFERELRVFIARHGEPGRMPTYKQLRTAGRHDLLNALHRAGGRQAVARRFGLDWTTLKKPPRYWNDPANLKRELLAYIAQHGHKGIMPTGSELLEHGRAGLMGAIQKHGGFPVVGERLGLKRPDARRLSGYWNDFANVVRELRTFIREHGRAGVMPTGKELRANGREDLKSAILRHGGQQTVAERLRLRRPNAPRPPGYWDDFANLARELQAYLAERGAEQTMPTAPELEAARRKGLVHGIGKHGGFLAVARRLKLRRVRELHTEAYWRDFGNVARELRAHIAKHGRPGIMPTSDEMIHAGRSRLNKAIIAHGGYAAVARRLRLKRPHARRPDRYYHDFDRLARALRAFARRQGHGAQVMPTQTELRAAGRHELNTAVEWHGGYVAVAVRLGLRPRSAPRKPPRYWNDFANVERELREFITTHNCGDVMPSRDVLCGAGRNDLAVALRKHGGSVAVAQRLGLRPASQAPRPFQRRAVTRPIPRRTLRTGGGRRR